MVEQFFGEVFKHFKRVVGVAVSAPARRVLDREGETHFELVKDLMVHPEVLKCKQKVHHNFHSRYEHMLLASKFAFYFAKQAKANVRICVRACMIHDVNTNWFYTKPACDLARQIGESQGVVDAIETHMTLNKAPRSKEAWIVAFSDGCSIGVEGLEFLKYSFKDFIRYVVNLYPKNIV